MSTPEPAYVARLGLNSKTPLNLVKNMPGYTTPVFKGKEEQRALVEQEVASKVSLIVRDLHRVAHHLSLLTQGFVPQELVAGEVNWFYSNLGIDDTYFQNESHSVISDHILALFGAKIMAYTKHDPSTLVIDLERIDERGNSATFIHSSAPGLTSTEGPGATCEARWVIFICDFNHSLGTGVHGLSPCPSYFPRA